MVASALHDALLSVRDYAKNHDGPHRLIASIDDVEREATYENLDRAMKLARGWYERLSEDARDGVKTKISVINDYTPVWLTILPEYLLNEDGTMRPIPHFMPTPDGAMRSHSAGNAVLYRGVKASVFERAIRVEKLFDGKAALEAGSTKDLQPVGTRSAYRVSIFDGQLHMPPLHPDEAREFGLSEDPDTPEAGSVDELSF